MSTEPKFAIILGMVLGLATVGIRVPRAIAGGAQDLGSEVWSVGVPCQSAGMLLQGASPKSGLLLDESCTNASNGNKYIPDIVLRRTDDGQVRSRKVIRDWHGFAKKRRGQFFRSFDATRWFNASLDPAFRFLQQPDTILMKYPPWLAVVDIRSGAIVRSLMPSPDLADPNSPALHVPIRQPFPMIVAVSPTRESIAVASNLGKGPSAFIFNSDLTKRVQSWALPRYAEGLVWSPNGRRIAILYDGKFDSKGKFVGAFPQWMPVRLPNVAIFDARSGTKLASFFTGGLEAAIAFSPDGSLIYVISETTNVTKLHKYAVSAFSSSNGKLARILRPSGPPVHDEFAVSPDGRFLAANASTDLPHSFWTEPPAFSNVTRVVVFDAQTGKVLFRHSRRIGAAVPLNPIFTPDGRLLIVQYGPDLSAEGKQRETIHIVAYSMAGS